VNNYFALKADEVLIDEPSLGLLAKLHEAVVVEISEFDACENGIALARLTAANFCEVGANVIYITEAGQRFVDSIMDS
jgi:ABC-type branched-subunit amino acid transport system ATPase component